MKPPNASQFIGGADGGGEGGGSGGGDVAPARRDWGRVHEAEDCFVVDNIRYTGCRSRIRVQNRGAAMFVDRENEHVAFVVLLLAESATILRTNSLSEVS